MAHLPIFRPVPPSRWTVVIAAALLAVLPAVPGHASTSPPPSPVPAILPAPPLDPADAMLLAKAAFWDKNGEHLAAFKYYTRVLAAAPNNPDALAGAAASALALGQTGTADNLLTHLHAVAATDGPVAAIERTPAEMQTLADARRLANGGRKDEALAQYRRLMPNGVVPDDLAPEYDQLLISSLPPDSVDANDALTALGALADKSPTDYALQLSYAKAMITLEGSRAAGIEKLRALAKGSPVAAEARANWRSALLWQGADLQAQRQLETYLSENPSDPELEAKRRDYLASLPSEAVQARMRGYEALHAKNTPLAEKEFQTALSSDPNDVDAIMMLAAIREQQGRATDVARLVDLAISLAPARKREILGTVGWTEIVRKRR